MEENRVFQYDAIRDWAIILVVCIHSMGLVIDASNNGNQIASAVDSFLSIRGAGVPLFIMLSGALLLGKQEPIAQFYIKRFKRLLLPFVVWCTIAYTLLFFQNDGTSVVLYIRGLIWGLATNNVHGIYWFVYTISILYVITPVLRVLTQKEYKSQMYILTLVIFVIFLAKHICPAVWGLHKWGFDYIVMLFYYLMGYIIVKELKGYRYFAVVNALIFILSYITMILLHFNNISSPLLMLVLSVSLFGLLLSCDFSWLKRIGGGRIAKYSYGIYLSHFMLISALVHTDVFQTMPVWIEPFVMVACVFLAEAPIFYCLERIGIKKYVM